MRLFWAWLGRDGLQVIGWGGMAVALTLASSAIAQTFHVPPQPAPATLAAGETLYLGPGGTLPEAFNALAGSTIHVVGGDFTDNGGSRGDVYVRSGTLGIFFDAESGSRITVTGGSLGFGYDAFGSSTTILSGGTAGLGLNVLSGAEMTIVGTSFTIGGNPVAGLSDPWDEFVVTQFNGARLAGNYLNGGTFGFDLNAAAAPFFNARFHPGSTLRLVLALPGDFDRSGKVDESDYELWKQQYGQVPAQPGLGADGNFDGAIDAYDYTMWRNHLPLPLAGDYNRDGVIDQLDYVLWKNSYGTTPTAGQGADGNSDGVVDAADYILWRNHFASSQPGGLSLPATGVPEPESLLLVCLALALLGGKPTLRRLGFPVGETAILKP